MRGRLTKAQQKQALREQGCVNCGQPYGDDFWLNRIQLDHYTPWADIPEEHRDDIDELQPMCARCNRYKNRYTYVELNLHLIPDHPRGFDWSTLAWVSEGLDPVPALWIHGEMFDVPIWPSDAAQVRVAVHTAPQTVQEPSGREK